MEKRDCLWLKETTCCKNPHLLVAPSLVEVEVVVLGCWFAPSLVEVKICVCSLLCEVELGGCNPLR